MSDNLSIVIKTLLSQDVSDIETQIKALSTKIKERIELKLKIDASDLQVLTKQADQIAEKLKTKTTMKDSQFINTTVENQAFNQISSRIREVRKNIDELAKIDINTNKQGQITSATLTYYNKKLGQTITETMGWSEAQKKVNGEMMKFKTFETQGFKYSDNMAKAAKEAEKLVKQNNAVTQSLLNQQNMIERRDFNYGKLITGVDASTFGSSNSFFSYIKKQYGDSAELIGKFNDKQLKTGEIITQANFRVKEGSDKWRMYQATLNKTTGDMRILDNGLKDVVNRQIGFNEAMKIAIIRITQWGIATSLVYGSLRQLKEGLQTLKEIDTELISIAKVTNYTNQEMKELVKTAVNAGQELGRTAQEYLKSVAEFSRAGMGKQSEEYAKLSLLLQNVGDITAETANETLIATDAGFQLGGSYEHLMGVIDKFNNISNLNATNIEKLSEAMKVGASVFNAAGMSIDETIAIIGTATATTQRAGSEISRAWRTILMNIRQVADEEAEVTEESMKKAEKALNSVGIIVRDSPSTFRPMFEIITDLGKSWDSLSQVQQAYIAESLAGKRQANVLISTLQNFDMVQKQLNESISASGSAIQENEIYMQSWEAKASQLSATATQFWTNTINTDFIKNIVDGLNSLIKILDFLVNNSLSSFVLKIALTTTALYGLGMAVNVLTTTAAFGGLVAAMSSFTTGASMFIYTIQSLTAKAITLNSALNILKTTMITHPLFFITAGVTAIYGIAKGIDALTTSAEEAKAQLDELKSSVTTLSGELKDIEDLQKIYTNLSKKENKSTEEKQNLLQVIKDLANIYPNIISQYDSEGEILEINNKKLTEYIDLKKEELRLKNQELSANFRVSQDEITDKVLGKPTFKNWKQDETSLTDWLQGKSIIETLQDELDIYNDLLDQLKTSGEEQVFFRGGWLNQETLEEEIAKTYTSLNSALSEQKTYIEQYKQGLKSALDINDDFKSLNNNALNSFIESIGDNLKKLETTGNKVDGLTFSESLGKSQNFVTELNKINFEFQKNKDNVNLTEEAYKQWHDEAVKALSDIILYEGKVGSRSTANDIAEDLVSGLGEINIASSEATSALEQHEKAVSTLATTYKESSASIKDLKNILSELDEGKGLSVDSISKILESYPELIDYLDDEVKLREKITDKVDDYQDAIYDAFVAIKQNSNEFYNSVKNENVDLFNNLAKAYNSDIDNWSNLAQAKQEINAKLISQLGADWVKYFEAFNVGNTLINPSSIGDWRRLESGDALAIDSTTAKQFELLNALNEATRKQAEKFKNLNVSSSLGSPSSSSFSSSKYISDQYALSISALNTEISQLEGLLSKLNPTSEEYRQKLQQINSLTKQKQTLTEQEAIRLRALRAETAKGTEEYDDYTKSIESLSSAWWDFENSMSDNSFKIINSQLSAFDETINDLNNQLSRSKTLQSALFEETEEYNNELLKQKNITDNLITSLKQKEQYIQKELASGKLSIAQNKELTTTLKQVKEAQEDLYISYLSDLKTYADEVKNIYQDMADSAIEAINDQMDIEDKRHDRIMDGYKDELKAIQEIINAKLDLIDEEENEADYQKELSKLLSERQDIQNQINALQMDDSIEAKMQLKKLNQELVDKQDEIEKKQHKHTVDLRKKNLQDQLKLYKKDIEEKQDAEDKKYKAEKNRLEDIKDDIKNYLNNILNDERNLLSNVKGDFNNFANFINDNMGRIGTSIKNKFSDKLDDVIEKINNVKYQINNIEIPINIPSSGGSNTNENINNWINSNLSTILSSYKSAGISTYTNPYTGVTYNTSTGQIISGSSNNGGNSNSRNKNNSSSNKNNSSSNNNSGSIGGVNNDGWEVRDNGSGGFEYVYVGHKGGIIPSYHSGGEVGSKTSNKTLDLVNKMFNVKPNEMVIKALREELMAPKQNVLNNFMPNLRNLVNSMTPNINLSPALAGTTNKNYYLTVNVDNLHTNNKKETNQVFNTMLKGIKKYS
jgi:TP901 family phage tail tape measure protein